MKGFLGISATKMSSIVFLFVTLMISLTLGSLTFLVNDNAASVPNVGAGIGFEGMEDEGANKAVEKAKNDEKQRDEDMGPVPNE